MSLDKNRFAIVFLLLATSLATQPGYAATGMSKNAFAQVKPDPGAVCRRLPEVKEIPFKGEHVNDEAYNEIVSQGKAAIPCLIEKITDTTRMKDPRSAPTYSDFRVGDLAFFLLVEITKTPFEQMLPDLAKSRMKNDGVYAYFEYVERPDNRKALQAKWKEWWAKNRD
jgi:hypothetical protein